MAPIDCRPCRLHPEAAYLRDVGYVFIDLNGRLFRMEEPDFDALKTRCTAGMTVQERQVFGDLLVECGTVTEVHDSFSRQDIHAHER